MCGRPARRSLGRPPTSLEHRRNGKSPDIGRCKRMRRVLSDCLWLAQTMDWSGSLPRLPSRWFGWAASNLKCGESRFVPPVKSMTCRMRQNSAKSGRPQLAFNSTGRRHWGMKLGAIFLKCAFVLLVPAFMLLFYIMASRRVGLQGIWKLALAGHLPSRVYVAMSCVAYASAIVSVIFFLLERR
jgi:hypothetical protein